MRIVRRCASSSYGHHVPGKHADSPVPGTATQQCVEQSLFVLHVGKHRNASGESTAVHVRPPQQRATPPQVPFSGAHWQALAAAQKPPVPSE